VVYYTVINQSMKHIVLSLFCIVLFSLNLKAQTPVAPDHSVLSSGQWYKIAVSQRGIYKLDYAFLQQIGVNPANINAANIRIYGNGGTVIKEKVSDAQPTDLIENAIYVSASGSTFSANDYVLFYANGPTLWEPDYTKQIFKHTPNYYEDKSYYFINVDLGPGKRVNSITATQSPNININNYNEYQVVELDSINLGNIGKLWYGKKMNTMNPASLSQNINFNLGSNIDSVFIATRVGSNNNSDGYINIKVNNNNISEGATGNISARVENQYVRTKYYERKFLLNSSTANFSYQYSSSGSGSAYIDFASINYKKALSLAGEWFSFRNLTTASTNATDVIGYTIQNATNGVVWDVTDAQNPVNLLGTYSGNNYTFSTPGGKLKEFVAFRGANFAAPSYVGMVNNQDLHGLSQMNYLIITVDSFAAAAEELAAFHRALDGKKVTIVSVDKIYNEFSSGGQDIAGIRNFIKLFYERGLAANERLKHVLLLGAASFDYKNKNANNTNIVPVFEADGYIYEDVNAIGSGGAGYTAYYPSDDFYAYLNHDESILDLSSTSKLDVGIGRIPAINATEALQAIAKIKNYVSHNSFGPWKNIVTYVADDYDPSPVNMNHLKDCETISQSFMDTSSNLTLNKIYADAYKIVSTASGGRYPMVNKAIDNQIYNGTFWMSYSGHGSPERWSAEAILTADNYNNWNNINKLPVIVTATCDFGRYDDPEERSAGVQLMMNPKGGSIAMVTTTQAVFATQNTTLIRHYTQQQFSKNENNQWPTLGEALTLAKNTYNSDRSNNNKFAILGDPALSLQMPKHKVVTDQLYRVDDGNRIVTDTIQALSRYMLTGSIRDENNNTLLEDFNGDVYVTIYDKKQLIQTVNPLAETKTYPLQANTIAKVIATVKNGLFEAQFVAPKDINYDYGFGKVSYYAQSNTTDAANHDVRFTIGGYNANAVPDNDVPIVQPYIDNDMFRDGGVTGPNPLLYVKLYDENGINISGSSLGHDLVAFLDDDTENPYILNSYYTTAPNDYRNGTVYFPLYNLPEGKHTLRVRAWDIYNNSGEGFVNFEVVNKDKGFIGEIYNYPNPVTDQTTFVVQHNLEHESMDITIQIFNAGGSLVKTLKESLVSTGNRTEISWNGLGEGNVPLSKGVYFYRVSVFTSKGQKAHAHQKLVLMR
jgi:hypothetical protein